MNWTYCASVPLARATPSTYFLRNLGARGGPPAGLALPLMFLGPYFHSQTFEMVLPAGSTSYSKTPHALFKRASFCEGVR